MSGSSLANPLGGRVSESPARVESGGERRVFDDGQPLVAVLADVRAYDLGHGRLRVPETRTGEATSWLDVQIEAWGVDVLGPLVAKMQAGVGLVGRLVLSESGVPIDAEQRTAAGAGVGLEPGADGGEMGAEVVDEIERRLFHVGFVPLSVAVEPRPVVVVGQLGKEVESRLGEVARGHVSRLPRCEPEACACLSATSRARPS